MLWFGLCVVVWALVLARLPRLPALLFTVFGSVPASVGLIALNHGYAPLAFVPLVLLGVFLEAGFPRPPPTWLTYHRFLRRIGGCSWACTQSCSALVNSSVRWLEASLHSLPISTAWCI